MAADAVRPVPHQEALVTADDGDGGGEDRGLGQAGHQGVEGDRLGDAADEGLRDQVQHQGRHDHAAHHRRQVGEDGEQGQGQDQPQGLGQHQQFQRGDADAAQGVDLVGDHHGADLGGVGRAAAAGDDDGGHQGAQFPQHREGDQVHHVEIAAVEAQLDPGLVGDHHPDQEGEHAQHRQGAPAIQLHHLKDLPPAQTPRVGQDAREGEGGLAEERQQPQAFSHSLPSDLPHPRQDRRGRVGAEGRQVLGRGRQPLAYQGQQAEVGGREAAELHRQPLKSEGLGQTMELEGPRRIQGQQPAAIEVQGLRQGRTGAGLGLRNRDLPPASAS